MCLQTILQVYYFFLSIHLAWNRPKKQAPELQPKLMNKATEPQEETISNCEDFHSKEKKRKSVA